MGDLGSIPGLGRCPGEGKGYPLQYSGLENSRDCIVCGGLKESDMTERLSLGPIGGKQYNWWKACFNISQMNEMNIKTQAAIRRDKLED